MNIPFSILKEKKLEQQCYDYHQSLAKRFYNSNKLNKSSNQKKPNKYSKKKIYNWFFANLDIKQKLKVCSIYNDWFIKILEQLLTYNEYDNKIKFKPKEIYNNFYKILNNNLNENYFNYSSYSDDYKYGDINEPQEYFNTFFEIKENDGNYNNENKKTYMEKSFLNELIFFSINKTNDILSLNEELLNNREKLQEYFDQFSNCKIFSENITVIKENNIFNFSFPNWVKEFKEGISVHQLIIICFEISISIYYQIFLNENAFPKFEIDSKIEDLYNMKLNMENYLAKETSNEKNPINEILVFKELDSDINSEENEKIYKEHEAISEYVYKIAFDHNQSSFYTDPSIKIESINNAIINLKKELKINISKFVDTITFIKANIIFKIQNILYNIIYQKIAALYNKRDLDEFCNDINEITKTKKKKKRNKKNKNEKQEEKTEEKNKIINIQETKEEKLKNTSEINLNENNNYEINDFNNVDDNKYSINCVDNKNNSNNSDEEDDEENQIFSNDSKNSNNITSNEDNNKEFIEMKYLDEKGKEIINFDKKGKKSEIDLLEEYIMENSKEKKNKRKKKKHKNKNKNNIINIEENKNNNDIKKDELKDEKENNINNNINIDKNEINIPSNLNEKKETNIEQIKDENKNKKNKEKYKDFYLFPTNKDKKNKNINNNNNNNNKSNLAKIDINNNNNNLILTNQESKEIKSKTTSEIIETNEVNNKNNICDNINDDINIINDKCLDLFKTKENNIEILGNKSKNEISIQLNDKNNIIEHTKEYNKIQNINLNNSTINNYVIIDKISSTKPSSTSSDNNELPKNIIPQILTPFNYSLPFHQLPNFYLYERNDLFEDLTKEIISHEEHITNNLNLLEQYRGDIYHKIKIFIKNILNNNNFEAELINYGSHETGLSIESSDIDILIKFCKKYTMNNISINNQQNIEEILSLIYNELNLEKEKFNILQINAIYTASVPVLKIKFDLDKIIPTEIKNKIKENYLFNFEEEILQLNFDFTFQEVEGMDIPIKIPSLEIINFIKGCLYIHKEIKPIILILKRYMKINKLNSSFHGGLSSYSLFLLLYSYIKSMHIPNNTIGHYLYGFFEFYSNFNFGIYLINSTFDCPFMLLDELHESGMLLIDPITSLNVSKSTFKIDQIKSVLTKGMVIIRNIFLTNKGKNYIYNINSDNKYIFLNELFKSRNGIMILDKIIPQMKMNNQNVIMKWKNI